MFQKLQEIAAVVIVDPGALGLVEVGHNQDLGLAKHQLALHIQKLKPDVPPPALKVADLVLKKPHLEEAVQLHQ
jgi:hypothetical protein